MEYELNTNGAIARTDSHTSFEMKLVGDKKHYPQSRGSGSDTKNGVYQRSLIDIKKNWTSDKVIDWFGPDNNEPEFMMKLIADNPTLLGLLLTKCTILHGQGLHLFKIEDDGKRRLLPFHNWPSEIQDFYELNDLDSQTHRMFCDHEFLGNYFTSFRFTQGSSRSRKRIAMMDTVSPICIRALKPPKDTDPIKRYGIAPTWQETETQHMSSLTDLIEVGAYDRKAFYDQKFKFIPGGGDWSQLIYHGKREIPGFPAYAIPHWYGARYHIELQNEIPKWHIANIINMWGARLKVSVSHNYIKSRMALINPDTDKNYTEEEVSTAISEMIRDLFTNPENVGRSLLSGHLTDHQGRIHEDIIITPIKFELKDDAYTALEPIINSKITSAVGVQAALAAMITDGKGMSSGSEQTQAWNIEAAKAINTQKMILKPLMFIHKYNGWDNRLTWGFPNPSLVTKDIAKEGIINKTPETKDPNDN